MAAGRLNTGMQDYGAMGSSIHPTGISNPRDFEEWIDSISRNIRDVNSGAKTLQEALKKIGTKRDNEALRNKVRSTIQRSNELVNQTTDDLRRVFVQVKVNREAKLRVEKLRSTFRDVVQCYNTIQKEVISHMRASLESQRHTLVREEDEDQAEREHVESARIASEERQKLLEDEERVRELEARDKEIRAIEAMVIDVNYIFRDLAVIVKDQGEYIDSIEQHMESAAANVESGREEIAKAAGYQRSYRKKMFIPIVLILIVAVVLIIIIVTTVR